MPLMVPIRLMACGSDLQRCLQNEFECTACSEERHKVLDIVQSQARLAEQHEKVGPARPV